MYKKLIILALSPFLYFSLCHTSTYASPKETSRLGVWISVFSEEKIIHSKENVDKLLKNCEKFGINDIYFQIYRSDKAYYNSNITDTTPYKNISQNKEKDNITYLIQKASAQNIKVHAWINLLSIAHNKKANIIKKYGSKVLTLDQHGRTSLKGDQKDKLDKYYIRENQLFLEPGDRNVREYLTSIVKEIVTKYPKFAGIHLDYIRYPSVVPFIPGSRFSSHGISYGYTKENLKNFKEQSGIDIIKSPYSRDNYKKWDDWRRNNITKLVKKISRAVKKINPDIEVSCTIVPSPERTYLVTLQDWTKWLNEDFVDYVTVMNYTDDTKLFKLYGRSIIALAPKNKLHIGIGAYLLKDKPDILKQQFNSLHELSPAGIVFFSYDDIVRDPSALKYHEKGS